MPGKFDIELTNVDGFLFCRGCCSGSGREMYQEQMQLQHCDCSELVVELPNNWQWSYFTSKRLDSDKFVHQVMDCIWCVFMILSQRFSHKESKSTFNRPFLADGELALHAFDARQSPRPLDCGVSRERWRENKRVMMIWRTWWYDLNVDKKSITIY